MFVCLIKGITKSSISFKKIAIPQLQGKMCADLVSSNQMSLFGSVNTKEKFCWQKISQILYTIWCGIIMIVSSFTMVTETMGVFQSQIKPLEQRKPCEYIFF